MIDERKKEIENEKYILTFDGIEEYLNVREYINYVV
jgi:hypothetical protein